MRTSNHVVALSLLFESIDRLAGSMPAGDNTSKGLPISLNTQNQIVSGLLISLNCLLPVP